MREIKFRAFTNSIMHYDPELIYNSNVDLNRQIKAFEEYDYSLMQYTGLTDKSGVEIYEGDIVKSESGNLYTVEFFDDGFKIVEKDRKLSDIYDLWHYIDNIYLLNVVGNIYENPELLEKENK